MKLLKTIIILIMTSSVFAIDITAHADITLFEGKGVGIGVASTKDFDDRWPVSLELASSAHFSLKEPWCWSGPAKLPVRCKDKSYADHTPHMYLLASAKLVFPFSEHESILVGQTYMIETSGYVTSRPCLSYKRKLEDKSLEFEIYPFGISFIAAKTLR